MIDANDQNLFHPNNWDVKDSSKVTPGICGKKPNIRCVKANTSILDEQPLQQYIKINSIGGALIDWAATLDAIFNINDINFYSIDDYISKEQISKLTTTLDHVKTLIRTVNGAMSLPNEFFDFIGRYFGAVRSTLLKHYTKTEIKQMILNAKGFNNADRDLQQSFEAQPLYRSSSAITTFDEEEDYDLQFTLNSNRPKWQTGFKPKYRANEEW